MKYFCQGGLYILGHVQIGSLDELEHDQDPSIVETPHWWQLIDHLKVKAFVEITVANTIREGIQQLVRYGTHFYIEKNTIVEQSLKHISAHTFVCNSFKCPIDLEKKTIL